MKLRLNHAIHNIFIKLQKQPALAWIISILWLLILGGIAYLWNLGNIGLVDETEPLFAEAARQMTITGDWITPYFNGETRFDKPPLIYWCMAICYKIFGVSEWSVRLPSALSAIAITALAFYVLLNYGYSNFAPVKSENSPQDIPENQPNFSSQKWISALIGSALIALNPEMIGWGRIGVSDMLLSGCMCSALLAFFLGYAETEKNHFLQDNKEENKTKKSVISRWYWAFYILSGLAVLAKGPVGIVLPVLIISSFLLYLGNFRQVLREMAIIPGTLLFLAIAVPWYILVTIANGEAYINSFFGYHNIERFTNVVNYHSAPWYFYFLVVLLGFAPWSVYLPLAITKLNFWKRTIWHRQPRSHQLRLFALFWFATIFIFFTIAVTKLPSYILPLMPAAGILVGLQFSSFFEPENRHFHQKENTSKIPPYQPTRFFTITNWISVLFSALLATSLFISPLWLKLIDDPSMPNLEQTVLNSGLLYKGGGILTTLVLAKVILLLVKKARWLWTVNLIGFAVFLIVAVLPALSLVDQMRQLPLREIAQTVIVARQTNEPIAMLGLPKPTLVFYTEKKIHYLHESPLVRKQLKTLAETQPKPPSILIIGTPAKFEEAELEANQYQIIDKAGAYQVARMSQQVIARLVKN
ncbi:glycosyltransferase family 39 protein [Ancylothrix sp. C2]|uniref:ArnT family glycosyltransferase n=1 Tax=Ancylothrix sp. D3o TaxID=2953691 RepID=UPI0021BB4C73|nr:glycosyltransferase family 39 protein [Ancylothrix sp. D3o]MCT7948545.1 glycosyltransferase family 39 protein [Ancylothrix sp. D3o]